MSAPNRTISEVSGVIVFSDGQNVTFSITREGSFRWGNEQAVIADAVEPCQAMAEALSDHLEEA